MAFLVELAAYPHDLYAPPHDGSGGPFTIGRVIHGSRSVGFTGWIGGVVVYDCHLWPKRSSVCPISGVRVPLG